ncbi:MAG: PAS domain-containing protein [Bryobacterales bacterium]|nr:PAS domain-containing protein [Bryobacterales bacterium]
MPQERDILEQLSLLARASDVELVESRATLGKMEVALGAIAEGIAATDSQGNIEWCNSSFESIVRRRRDEILGHFAVEMLPLFRDGIEVARWRHPVVIAMDDELVDSEVFELCLEGRQRVLEISARPVCLLQHGKSIILTVRDITRSRIRERVLTEQKAFLQLLQKVTDAANSSDSEETVVRDVLSLVCAHGGWPAAFATRFPCPKPSSNRDCVCIWHLESEAHLPLKRQVEENRETLVKAAAELANTRRPVAISNPSGLAIPVLSGREVVAVLHFFSSASFASSDDLLERMSQVGVQLGRVVERKRAETALRQAHTALEQRVQERTRELAEANEALRAEVQQRRKAEALKDELVSTVSHELRTPLSSLLGFSEIMLDEEYPREQQCEFLNIIRNESLRLTQLINDFLDLQRLESGRMAYALEPVKLEPLFRDMRAMFEPTSGSHRFVLETAADLQDVQADPNRLKQVLTNLVSNAVKFSPQGGDILLRARNTDSFVEVMVEDHGIGMPREAIPKLFQKFYRVDNADTRKIGGTGLGLALIREIVEAHRGTVWVESEHGKGSRFYLTLPVL